MVYTQHKILYLFLTCIKYDYKFCGGFERIDHNIIITKLHILSTKNALYLRTIHLL